MRLIAFIAIFMSLQVHAAEPDFELNIKELAVADNALTESSSNLCDELGSEVCEIFMKPCKVTPMPNTCFQRSFLFYAIDLEICGEEKVSNCLKERTDYWDKISDFSDAYASNPGIGRAALNACHSFFIVKPKSEKLKNIQNAINQVTPGMGIYTENKKYYECIKENFLKRAIP